MVSHEYITLECHRGVSIDVARLTSPAKLLKHKWIGELFVSEKSSMQVNDFALQLIMPRRQHSIIDTKTGNLKDFENVFVFLKILASKFRKTSTTSTHFSVWLQSYYSLNSIQHFVADCWDSRELIQIAHVSSQWIYSIESIWLNLFDLNLNRGKQS